MPSTDFGPLIDAVQRNCNLADAHHAREKSLCTYLLGMREYFRWAAELPLGAAPERARLGEWIARQEQNWDLLRDAGDSAFAPLPLGDGIDPFDEASVNAHLVRHGLVYGAGVGLFGAPLFFLAARDSEVLRDGARVIVAGPELARGVTAPPAASRDGTVIVRLDALRRWLWTRAETAHRGLADNAFAAALRAYADSPDAGENVERMARGEIETLILHELGELRAALLLGAEWEEMLAEASDRRTELLLRAVRDLLADCIVTLPQLIERDATASLIFWFANFDGLRRLLAPELAAAYHSEGSRIDYEMLKRAVQHGQATWLALAQELLSIWRRSGGAAVLQRAQQLAQPH